MKFILAAEWLNKKGIVFCPKWIKKSTTRQARGLKAVNNQDSQKIIPLPPIDKVIRPSSDVTVRTFEAEHWRWLSRHGVQSCYGYDDGYERLICKEDGTVVLKQKCMRIVVVTNLNCSIYQLQLVQFLLPGKHLPLFLSPSAVLVPQTPQIIDQFHYYRYTTRCLNDTSPFC